MGFITSKSSINQEGTRGLVFQFETGDGWTTPAVWFSKPTVQSELSSPSTIPWWAEAVTHLGTTGLYEKMTSTIWGESYPGQMGNLSSPLSIAADAHR